MDNTKTKVWTTADTRDLITRYSAFAVLALLILFNMIFTKNFASTGTLWNIITQTCTIILTGMGMTMVISTGGIDISDGEVMALSGMTSALMLPYGLIPAILVGLALSVCSGAIAVFMIGKLKVQPMVVTLALMIGIRGVAQVINDAKIFNISGANADAYIALGTARIFGLPVQIIPVIVVIAAMWFIMNKTVLGSRIQAVGDNSSSARMAGINSTRTLMVVYMTSAFLAGVAGIFATAKIGAADANSLGNLAELDAIAAVAVGGTSMSGGRAKIFGTVVGALIMQLINITVNMNNITYEYASVLKAIIIIIAVKGYVDHEKTANSSYRKHGYGFVHVRHERTATMGRINLLYRISILGGRQRL